MPPRPHAPFDSPYSLFRASGRPSTEQEEEKSQFPALPHHFEATTRYSGTEPFHRHQPRNASPRDQALAYTFAANDQVRLNIYSG